MSHLIASMFYLSTCVFLQYIFLSFILAFNKEIWVFDWKWIEILLVTMSENNKRGRNSKNKLMLPWGWWTSCCFPLRSRKKTQICKIFLGFHRTEILYCRNFYALRKWKKLLNRNHVSWKQINSTHILVWRRTNIDVTKLHMMTP